MDRTKRDKQIEYLGGFLTESRKEQIRDVLNLRTRRITVVLDDIHRPQNGSAVIRTCECLGIQSVHVVERDHKYKLNRAVLVGAGKWVDIHRYNHPKRDNAQMCIDELRAAGYRIVVTDPDPAGCTPSNLPLDQKTAIVFGSEKFGIGECMKAEADERLHIPMYGFTQSYNLSVSAAVVLTGVVERLRQSDLPWQLSDEELADLTHAWYKKCVRHPHKWERLMEAELDATPQPD